MKGDPALNAAVQLLFAGRSDDDIAVSLANVLTVNQLYYIIDIMPVAIPIGYGTDWIREGMEEWGVHGATWHGTDADLVMGIKQIEKSLQNDIQSEFAYDARSQVIEEFLSKGLAKERTHA